VIVEARPRPAAGVGNHAADRGGAPDRGRLQAQPRAPPPAAARRDRGAQLFGPSVGAVLADQARSRRTIIQARPAGRFQPAGRRRATGPPAARPGPPRVAASGRNPPPPRSPPPSVGRRPIAGSPMATVHLTQRPALSASRTLVGAAAAQAPRSAGRGRCRRKSPGPAGGGGRFGGDEGPRPMLPAAELEEHGRRQSTFPPPSRRSNAQQQGRQVGDLGDAAPSSIGGDGPAPNGTRSRIRSCSAGVEGGGTAVGEFPRRRVAVPSARRCASPRR